jgi:carbonic anhydrase
MNFPGQLIDGYRAFLDGRLAAAQARYRELAERQSPQVMVVGCCDSRVAPEAIFDAGPGELFVVRNVANLVPPYAPDGHHHGVSSALEFAIQALKVRHIVVLGHARCGGVRAFVEDAEPLSPGDFIGQWMKLLGPAAEMLGPRGDLPMPDYITKLEHASLRKSLDNLMTFPFIRTRVEAGKLELHAAYFGVATGELMALDRESDLFVPIAAEEHARALATPRF